MEIRTRRKHRASPWAVTGSIVIDAAAGEVWSAMATPGNLESCHPFCRRNPVSRWPGRSALDEVHYLNGVVYERRFRGWEEGAGYDLDIYSRGARIATVAWRIEAADRGRTRLRITVEPDTFREKPWPWRWLAHHAVLRPKLRRYLDSVVRGFEWFVTRGEPVPRNAFGKHPWFSAG